MRHRILTAFGILAIGLVAMDPIGAARAHAEEAEGGAGGDDGVPVILPVILIDLRAPAPGSQAAGGARAAGDERAASRDPLVAALAAADGIALRRDEGLLAALAGVPAGDRRSRMQAARDALARAREAHGALDCEAAIQAARAAVDELAALQAAGVQETDMLRRAYAYQLVCAHDAGNAGAAMDVVRQLHRLAGAGEAGEEVGPPPGVSERVWDAYPVLDATASARIVELSISTEPAGAAVWVDYRPAGDGYRPAGDGHDPAGDGVVRVLVQEGEHIVAAASGAGTASQRVRVAAGQTQQSVHLDIPAVRPRWPAEAAQVARWRGGHEPVDGASMGALMAGLDVRFALVLPGNLADTGDRGDRVDIWALSPGAPGAERVGLGSLERPDELAGQVVSMARDRRAVALRVGQDARNRWNRGPNPTAPLLREGDVPRRGAAGAAEGRQKKWWVYVTVLGAVAAGSLIILAQDLADDRQRIELRWP